MAMFRLNTYLEKRGFKNITSNFGYGKANADWVLPSKNVKVSRRSSQGIKTITLYHNNNLIGCYDSHSKERFQNDLTKII